MGGVGGPPPAEIELLSVRVTVRVRIRVVVLENDDLFFPTAAAADVGGDWTIVIVCV